MNEYPQKFDSSKLDNIDKSIIQSFFDRRKIFDVYIEQNKLKIFTCPCCGYPTLAERGGFSMCTVCLWEDDGQDNETADEVWGGPNSDISLSEGRIQIGKLFQRLSMEVNGQVHNSPQEVFHCLSDRDNIISTAKQKISYDTKGDDPAWKKLKRLREETIKSLLI